MFCGREWNISAKRSGGWKNENPALRDSWEAELEKEGKLGKPGFT